MDPTSQIATDAGSYLISQGMPGIVILGLLWLVKRLLDRNDALVNQLVDLGSKSTAATMVNTAALETLTDYVRSSANGGRAT